MSADRPDFDRALRTWFEDGPTVMNDRVVDTIADRIARQPQRRTWRLPWRPFMNAYVKPAAGLAAVLVVAVVGYNLLARQPGFGGGTPSAGSTSAPSVQPSPSPGAGTVVELPEGSLPGGRYRIGPFTAVPSLTAAADVPSGWFGAPPWAVAGPTTEEPPDGILIGFFEASGLFSDPCHWDVDGTGSRTQPGDIDVGPAVIDLVEALQASEAYTSTTPSQVSFGEFLGYEMEIQLPDVDLSECDKDDGRGRYFVFSGDTPYAQGNGTDGDRWHLFVVDVDGTRVIVAVLYFEGTPVAEQEAAQAIIELLEFAP